MAKQLPPGAATNAVVQGEISGVPCPWCGTKNDFRELYGQQLLDTGHCMLCDRCGRSMEVTAIRPITLVAVRKSNNTSSIGRGGGAVARTTPQAQQAQQRPAPGGGFVAGVKRLLGGPK